MNSKEIKAKVNKALKCYQLFVLRCRKVPNHNRWHLEVVRGTPDADSWTFRPSDPPWFARLVGNGRNAQEEDPDYIRLENRADERIEKILSQVLGCEVRVWGRYSRHGVELYAGEFGREVKDVWLTPTVRGLIRGIDHPGEFHKCPVLADALEEAGCDDVQLLRSLRTGVGRENTMLDLEDALQDLEWPEDM